MDKIEKQVRLLHKSLRGEITVPNLIKYLERYGYNTVFFNTESGDYLMRSYLDSFGIDKKKVPAFTYNGVTKVVFVDDLSPITNKIYSLLHELGHITLGHMDELEYHTIDKRSTENECEAFAYAALHYQSRSFFRKTKDVIYAVCDSVISFFRRAGGYKCRADETDGEKTEKTHTRSKLTYQKRKNAVKTADKQQA